MNAYIWYLNILNKYLFSPAIHRNGFKKKKDIYFFPIKMHSFSQVIKCILILFPLSLKATSDIKMSFGTKLLGH